ncbi:MAG: antitoxin [Acidobacteria bacterium]|nr:antitoxin [Acidobacteriota bacterium]
MRTTVTLDPDTEHLLRIAMRERNLTFKAALNDAIRQGLRGRAADAEPPFVTMAKPMRLRAGIDPGRLHDLDAALEVRRFQALNARLERERESR